jgi:hypothetical protein
MARAVPQNHDFAWLALAFQDFFSARFLAKPLTFVQFVLIFRAPLKNFLPLAGYFSSLFFQSAEVLKPSDLERLHRRRVNRGWGFTVAGVFFGRVQNQRPSNPYPFLKEIIPISLLARRSCFLVNPCSVLRFAMSIADTGRFAKASIKNAFIFSSFAHCVMSPVFLSCRLATSLACCGRPALNLSKRFATAAILLFRNCRN